jgi:hypothetical protein
MGAVVLFANNLRSMVESDGEIYKLATRPCLENTQSDCAS